MTIKPIVPIGMAVLVGLFDVARLFGCSGWSTGCSISLFMYGQST
jgi:hypothetical protein